MGGRITRVDGIDPDLGGHSGDPDDGQQPQDATQSLESRLFATTRPPSRHGGGDRGNGQRCDAGRSGHPVPAVAHQQSGSGQHEPAPDVAHRLGGQRHATGSDRGPLDLEGEKGLGLLGLDQAGLDPVIEPMLQRVVGGAHSRSASPDLC